jgi:DNA-binding MarR family transcriptional regulator
MPEIEVKEPLGRILANIGRDFLSGLHSKLKHLDIERSYYPLLLIEAANGRLTQQELAHKLSCDKVQVVRIIDYLSSKGYVVRERDASDKRKYNLNITPKARTALPDIKKALKDTSELAFRTIPGEKEDELMILLRTIEKNLKHL